MSEDFSTAEQHQESREEQYLKQILHKYQIHTVFQPIVSLRDASVLGYEALSRGPEGTIMESPTALFAAAEKHNMLWELEQLCRSTALKSAHALGYAQKLFLNVNPNILDDHKFRQGFTLEYLQKFNIDPANIIFEITEHSAVMNIGNFKKTVHHYKEQGFGIAIDDGGGGYSGLNLISDIHPHYLKLDMNLIRSIDKDSMKQALVRGMHEFSKLSDTRLIAEGIETREELSALIEIGVHYGQGFYIQHPLPYLPPLQPEVTEYINDANSRKNYLYGYRLSQIYISNICENILTVHGSLTLSQADEILRGNPALPGFCIVENDNIKGAITKAVVNSRLSGRYGYSLNAAKPIALFMNSRFLCVPHDMPIDQAAKLAMDREPETLYDFITVTRDDHYLGIVTVKNIIEKTIEIEVGNAKHLNPLTELPGNLLIEQHLEKCVHSSLPYAILYMDIDNFKAYNDTYGFENGDKVIRQLAKIIGEHLPSHAFIGHIGGDDFVAVINTYECSFVCEQIIAAFESSKVHFYHASDIKKGYVISQNRHGVEESFPLLSLSIAVLTNQTDKYFDIYALSEKASDLKKKCKQTPGSSFMIE